MEELETAPVVEYQTSDPRLKWWETKWEYLTGDRATKEEKMQAAKENIQRFFIGDGFFQDNGCPMTLEQGRIVVDRIGYKYQGLEIVARTLEENYWRPIRGFLMDYGLVLTKDFFNMVLAAEGLDNLKEIGLPMGYGWEDYEDSIQLLKDAGVIK